MSKNEGGSWERKERDRVKKERNKKKIVSLSCINISTSSFDGRYPLQKRAR